MEQIERKPGTALQMRREDIQDSTYMLFFDGCGGVGMVPHDKDLNAFVSEVASSKRKSGNQEGLNLLSRKTTKRLQNSGNVSKISLQRMQADERGWGNNVGRGMPSS